MTGKDTTGGGALERKTGGPPVGPPVWVGPGRPACLTGRAAGRGRRGRGIRGFDFNLGNSCRGWVGRLGFHPVEVLQVERVHGAAPGAKVKGSGGRRVYQVTGN